MCVLLCLELVRGSGEADPTVHTSRAPALHIHSEKGVIFEESLSKSSKFPDFQNQHFLKPFVTKMKRLVSRPFSLDTVQLYEKFRFFSLIFSILNILEACHLPSEVL